MFSHGLGTYHIDELNEGKTESNIHFLCHVLHRSDQLVVPSEQISHKPFFVLRAPTWNKGTHLSYIKEKVHVARFESRVPRRIQGPRKEKVTGDWR
jgi:hypothetical protein